jgi:hypothetical protein
MIINNYQTNKMSLETNNENINIQTNILTGICCSFCRNTGHNITTCNDLRLLDFERLCITRKTNLDSTAFYFWLLHYSMYNRNVTRSYAIRYCGCSIREYLMSCVNHIVRRISGLNGFQQPVEDVVQEETSSQNNYVNNGPRLMDETMFRDIVSRSDQDFLRIFEDSMRSRKFNIQTNIVECSQTNNCECSICYESKNKHEFIKLNCEHEFCKECIKQSLQNVTTEKPLCAFCRSEIINMELTSQEVRNELNELIV